MLESAGWSRKEGVHGGDDDDDGGDGGDDDDVVLLLFVFGRLSNGGHFFW